jgi:N6-adenosine-specific RNA methylase IME4
MKFNVIVSDPPWSFSDPLTHNSVKRGASSNYSTMTIEDIKNLPIEDIAEDDAILVLWCPSSLLQQGLDVMKSWGFEFKQTHIWVKTKQEPLKDLLKKLKDDALYHIMNFNMNTTLAFGMGRLFRQTHEIALIGVRGKIYKYLENKSQRSVDLFPALKHSKKPETIQNMLDIMFPCFPGKKLEMFARRDREGWLCIGNESSLTNKEDIRDSIKRIQNLQTIEKTINLENKFVLRLISKIKESINTSYTTIVRNWNDIPL